jgi:hypothetical protein
MCKDMKCRLHSLQQHANQFWLSEINTEVIILLFFKEIYI